MKIYNGLRYLAIGNRSLFTSSDIRIEKVYRPFSSLWKLGLDIPIVIKNKLYYPGNKDLEYNPEVVEYIKKYVDVKERDLGTECGQESLMVINAISRQDDSIVGGIDDAYKYIRQGITEFFGSRGCQYSNIGYIPKEKKWAGWSHRAIHAFGIGDIVKKGDIAFRTASIDELYNDYLDNEYRHEDEVVKIKDGIRIEHKMVKCRDVDCPHKGTQSIDCDVTEESLSKNHTCTYIEAESDFQEIKCGKGRWEATTLDEAKQMAIDFSESVS